MMDKIYTRQKYIPFLRIYHKNIYISTQDILFSIFPLPTTWYWNPFENYLLGVIFHDE